MDKNALVTFPSAESARKVFTQACKELDLGMPVNVKDLTIYEMTDGMRTTTDLGGADAYFDGGIFALRLIHLLKVLGGKSCYVNVIEERHKLRRNYDSIFGGLRRLYPVYRRYSRENDVRLRFIGDLGETLEPQGTCGDFATDLKALEDETRSGKKFTAFFLINYSLEWAMRHDEGLRNLPAINQIVRHTKLQVPTGMLLPPFLSDYSSCVYVQQGSSSRTWTDSQLSCLVAVALRSMVLNQGTQYLKKYTPFEVAQIRAEREEKLYLAHRHLFGVRGQFSSDKKILHNPKRAIIAGPLGPEIYEF